MSAQWLDDLSEDWVSQPRSSSSPISANAGVPQSNRSTRSRIPQIRRSLGTHTSAKSRTAGSSTMAVTTRTRAALSEKSGNPQSPAGTQERKKPESVRSGLSLRSQSECSQGSVICDAGTTKRASSASPPKDRRQYETPEWRRRLLQGKTDYGEKVDLFSPMGLERMFQKPPGNSVALKEKQRRLPGLKGLQEMPSSPPPWPCTSRADTSGMFTDGSRLDVVDEHDSNMGALDDEGVSQDTQSHGAAEPSGEQDQNGKRMISGPSVRSDSFSPVFISKRNGSNGGIEYAALDLSKTELEQELAKRRAESQSRAAALRPPTPVQDQSGFSESLPDDLETGTPDAVPFGDFVSIKRGGYSAEGSFLHRPLSPSPSRRPTGALDDTSLRNDSSHLSAAYDYTTQTDASIRPPAPTPPIHATPPRPRQQDYLSPTRLNSSPLKLFGAHDTFTTNRLQRRMSQLELNEKDQKERPETQLSTQREATEEPSQIIHPSRHVSIANQFGEGELDEYPFAQQGTVQSPQSSDNEGVIRSQSPSPTVAPPGSKEPFRFRIGSASSEVYDTFKQKRKHSKFSTRTSLSLPKRSAHNTLATKHLPKLVIQTDVDQNQDQEISFVAEGKRPRSSPPKHPTPKRRRTLVFADMEEQATKTPPEAVLDSHDQIQSVIGRKRKDARQGNTFNAAGPEVLARRHILRPRNPTPSQRRREEIEQEVMDVSELYFNSSPRLQKIREHLQLSAKDAGSPNGHEEEQAVALAEEVAAFSVKVQGGMKNEGRKKSVTTQDFLDEAMKIMDFFRKGKRPTSALSSLEESEDSATQEADRNRVDVEVGDMTLSRPPSREGRVSQWRERDVAELDPAVETHLKQFKDKEDEDFVASSFQSLQTERISERVPSPAQRPHVESDPPNIVVYENPKKQARDAGKSAESDGPSSKSSSMPSHKSHPSIDSSVGRTTVTTTSNKSGVGTLHPHAVPHLLAEEANGMHFDKEQGKWVRIKSPPKEKKDRDVSSLTQSDEDPFEEIPDLTFDEAQEREMISPSRRPTELGDLRKYSEERVNRGNEEHSRPRPKIKVVPPSARRVLSHARSVSDPEGALPSTEGCHNLPSKTLPQRDRDLVEHEIKINEGRGTPKQAQNGARKVSQLRISFSSPLVTKQLSPRPSTAYKSVSKSPKFEEKARANREKQQKGHVLAQQSLEPVEEHHEVSVLDFADDQRRVNFSVSLSAPLAVVEQQNQDVVEAPPSSPSLHTTFYMSELSEFTISHGDDELNTQPRTIVKRGPAGLASINESRFENGNAALVKALQDVEPEEPFWEDLKHIALKSKNISSLQLLDVLCDRAQALDLSDNEISQLSGAPSSLRCLDIRNNLITSLTSWDHLTNLQYIDVSNNDIHDLSGFGGLIHLRELKANDNCISSLDGILDLDGLLSLSLQNNRVESLNLSSSNLRRLERLNLTKNKLSENQWQNDYFLPSLTELHLDENGLTSFRVPAGQESAPRLHTLHLCNNRLDSIELDSSRFPVLRRVYLDKNQLIDLSGLQSLRHLDVLSIRNQQYSPVTAASYRPITSTLPDARSVFLSGTHITLFKLPENGLHHLANLELASCSLTFLPEDFASKVPNLRRLNLNFNNIKDIAPLIGLKALELLLLANNRIGRLRKLAMVLDRLCRSPRELDLRNNPVVAGFYDTSVAMNGGSMALAAVQTEEPSSEAADLDDVAKSHYCPTPASSEADATYRDRLDEDTRLRRRVHEILLANSLPKLRTLDGLAFKRDEVMRKDQYWHRLVELGVLKVSERDER